METGEEGIYGRRERDGNNSVGGGFGMGKSKSVDPDCFPHNKRRRHTELTKDIGQNACEDGTAAHARKKIHYTQCSSHGRH